MSAKTVKFWKRRTQNLTDQQHRHQLGEIIHEAREDRGLSGRALARAAHVDARWLAKLERGIYATPDPRHLHRLAKVLGIETISLFAVAEYGEGLPPLAPYLRAKYDLPPGAIEQLQAHFELLAERYRGGEGDANVEHYPTASRRHTHSPTDGS